MRAGPFYTDALRSNAITVDDAPQSPFTRRVEMRRTLVALSVAGLAGLGSSGTHALPCSVGPFSDVTAGNSSCSSVEWLKNRQVTLGCGGALYCPDAFVTRIQMALFMQRLADAVAQQPVGGGPPAASRVAGPLSLATLDITPDNVPCTTFVAIAGYPRTAIVSAQASLQMGAGGAGDVGLQIVHTTDGNTDNYQSLPGHVNQVTTVSQAAWSHISDSMILPIPAGQATKIGTAFFSFAGNTEVASVRCNVVVEVQSRTGTAGPFDEVF
jgi:hypothetical protein